MKRTIIRYEDLVSFNSLFNAWIKISTGDGKGERKDVIEIVFPGKKKHE